MKQEEKKYQKFQKGFEEDQHVKTNWKFFDESCVITGLTPGTIKDLAIPWTAIQYSKDLLKKIPRTILEVRKKIIVCQGDQKACLEASNKITNSRRWIYRAVAFNHVSLSNILKCWVHRPKILTIWETRFRTY